MQRTVFILGAGASKQAGAPIMHDFIDVARDLRLGGEFKVSGDEEYFDKAFEAIETLQNVHSKAILDINNIETVFATFEFAKLIDRLPGYDKEGIEEIIFSLKKLIVRTLEDTIKYRVSGGGNIINPPSPYGEFVDLILYLQKGTKPNHKVSIITFNYDVSIDYALHLNNLGPDYHLTDGESHGLSLFKLHGSLNWKSCKQCGEIIPFNMSDFLHRYSWPNASKAKHVFLHIGSSLGILEHCKGDTNSEPVIVPPTWDKSKYHTQLTRVWSKAALELSKADNIIIIGYSLPETDSFFRYLYALGTVGRTILRRFWVFNPDESVDVKERFQNILGTGAKDRFEYIPDKFEIAIKTLKERLSNNR